MVSILNEGFAEYFGFTPDEVAELLAYYGVSSRKQEVKNCDLFLKPFQNRTPVNITNLRIGNGKLQADAVFFETFGNLFQITGKKEEIPKIFLRFINILISNILMDGFFNGLSLHQFLNLLLCFHIGLLHQLPDNTVGGSIGPVRLWELCILRNYIIQLAIPNTEIRYIYRRSILEWFQKEVTQMNLSTLYQAVLEGNAQAFSDIVSGQLAETISFFDYAENYYHGFLCGLLKGCPGYFTLSNRESGNGRPDIVLKTPSVRGMAILMELKIVKEFEQMEAGCDASTYISLF